VPVGTSDAGHIIRSVGVTDKNRKKGRIERRSEAEFRKITNHGHLNRLVVQDQLDRIQREAIHEELRRVHYPKNLWSDGQREKLGQIALTEVEFSEIRRHVENTLVDQVVYFVAQHFTDELHRRRETIDTLRVERDAALERVATLEDGLRTISQFEHFGGDGVPAFEQGYKAGWECFRKRFTTMLNRLIPTTLSE
jgi:hypothetical protein